ncbi:hypothetical protein NIA71_01230 [Ihubacter massiliensis]|uniref:hypothetical protein n=1 Tax=Ihubacter massiliensis TaxID=1852367 RepID=UPI0020968A80|nr:hypothetical protein [Ihubacter massiliensis]MCI7301305.1 hypothetical protein [Clostridia bacterium]MCO7120577.1 hypothetical protein [Ihubacter massiliensis]MDY3010615.1 hypothetical protein [Clostridiales Family XIII bacterium]
MKGKWKVTFNPAMENSPYGVVRIIDLDKPEHSGNREYYVEGFFKSKAQAEEIANRLNGDIDPYEIPPYLDEREESI